MAASGHKKTSRRGRLDRTHGCSLMSASPGVAAGRRAGSGHAGAGRRGRCSMSETRCKRTSSSLEATQPDCTGLNAARQAKLRPTRNIHTRCGVGAAGMPEGAGLVTLSAEPHRRPDGLPADAAERLCRCRTLSLHCAATGEIERHAATLACPRRWTAATQGRRSGHCDLRWPGGVGICPPPGDSPAFGRGIRLSPVGAGKLLNPTAADG